MGVRIKVAAVVAHCKEEDPRFVDLYGRMKKDFADEQFVKRVCLHEAAHAELMEQDGIPNIEFVGPDIIYNPYTDRFIATGARVFANDPNAVVDDDYILRAATHGAAGGIALEMAGYTDTGDTGDFEDFKRLYDKNPPKSGEPADALWKRARQAAAEKLSDSTTKVKVKERSQRYVKELCSGL
jgi:hypothetical protein